MNPTPFSYRCLIFGNYCHRFVAYKSHPAANQYGCKNAVLINYEGIAFSFLSLPARRNLRTHQFSRFFPYSKQLSLYDDLISQIIQERKKYDDIRCPLIGNNSSILMNNIKIFFPTSLRGSCFLRSHPGVRRPPSAVRRPPRLPFISSRTTHLLLISYNSSHAQTISHNSSHPQLISYNSSHTIHLIHHISHNSSHTTHLTQFISHITSYTIHPMHNSFHTTQLIQLISHTASHTQLILHTTHLTHNSSYITYLTHKLCYTIHPTYYSSPFSYSYSYSPRFCVGLLFLVANPPACRLPPPLFIPSIIYFIISLSHLLIISSSHYLIISLFHYLNISLSYYLIISLLYIHRHTHLPFYVPFSISVVGTVLKAFRKGCGTFGCGGLAAPIYVVGVVKSAFKKGCGVPSRRWPAAFVCVVGAIFRAGFGALLYVKFVRDNCINRRCENFVLIYYWYTDLIFCCM